MPDKKHILLIEDSPKLRDTLMGLLDEQGYYVDATSNTADALQMLERGAYDLVLSDNNFPRFNDGRSEPMKDQGFEILQWMRLSEQYCGVPLILHTGDDAPDMLARVERHGGIFHAKGSLGILETVENAMR